MASLVKNQSIYGLIWTDSRRYPKQVRESLKTTERHRATAKKKQLEWEYLEGEHDPWRRKWYERPQHIDPRLSELIGEFIRFKTNARGELGWNENTAKREKYVLQKMVRLLGDPYITDLTADHLEKFYYRKDVSSDHTRNGDYISVNTFLNWCMEQGHLKTKPHFRPSKPQSKVPKFLYPEDLSELIRYRLGKIERDIRTNHLVNDRNAAYWHVYAWMILAGTGMRPVELSRLKLSHIHNDWVLVGADYTTKTRSERRVPLLFEAQQAVQILTDPNVRRREPTLAKSTYLLGRKPDYAKKELSYDFTDSWKACFPDRTDRTLYNLKDTFCVRFLSDDSVPSPSGMKLNDLREILGHASLNTTQRYLKAVPYGVKVSGTIWDFTGKIESG